MSAHGELKITRHCGQLSTTETEEVVHALAQLIVAYLKSADSQSACASTDDNARRPREGRK